MIQLHALGVQIGGHPALSGISLTLERGHVLGLIGPSGSGKSILLRVLATLLVPTAGTARIGGYSLRTERSRVRRLIGYLPAQMGDHDHLTAVEYLRFYSDRRLSLAEQRRRIENLLMLLNLAGQRHRFLPALSHSARQRLSLARCLLPDPAVLLLDNPTAGLDPDEREELWSVLAALTALQKTMVIASHDLEPINRLATQVAGLRAGALAYLGPPAENPAELYREIGHGGGGAG